ncbi:hypothetical protein KSZ_36210 [Dictyobacter formicarum]|uniref:Uncharacterized protein n=1 Tax=Dictyobacter formicarum TaxID=2778368 RepID=A0ABQ3VHT4_9CHLR|nr:hypothetical protein KSZ_36210 [Dictyobacter formicarum]
MTTAVLVNDGTAALVNAPLIVNDGRTEPAATGYVPVYVARIAAGLVVFTRFTFQFAPEAVTLVKPTGTRSNSVIGWLSDAAPARLLTVRT